MKSTAGTGLVRGYAPDKKAEKRLRALGIKTIYCAHDGEPWGKFTLRADEVLKVVDGFRAFSDLRPEIFKAVETVHAWGSTIIDAETGLNSREHWPAMLTAALWPNQSAEHQRLMSQAAKAKKTAGRMPDREAQTHWRNPKLSVDEALDLMTGWKKATAYATFGVRGIGAGRRSKNLKT